MTQLKLQILSQQFSIHRLAPESRVPDQVYTSNFYSITKTADELSIVCDASLQLAAERTVSGWSCFRVVGLLDFSLTGIMAGLSTSLAEMGISLFAISTYDTDYILVKTDQLEGAITALQMAGHTIVESSPK